MYVFSEEWIDQDKVRDSSPTLIVQINDTPMPISDEFLYEIFSEFGFVHRIGISAESDFRFLVRFESLSCAVIAKSHLHGQRLVEDYEDYGELDINFFHHIMENEKEERAQLRAELHPNPNEVKDSVQEVVGTLMKLCIPQIQESFPSNSASLKFSCEICVEQKHVDDLFQVQACTHSYCTYCITRYIISKLDQNITWVKCPVESCEGYLETEHCRSILPNDVYERWGKALCEALIPRAEKFYCPFKDCSAVLIKDGDEVVRESECPHCFRLFCVQCESPWHAEMECEEFQSLSEDERGREDIMLMKLAKKEKWMRCPSCKFYVQKKDGCLFVKCRCGVDFCYSCGKQPTISHYCMYCRH